MIPSVGFMVACMRGHRPSSGLPRRSRCADRSPRRRGATKLDAPETAAGGRFRGRGGTGRRAGLKIQFWRQSVGSTPTARTTRPVIGCSIHGELASPRGNFARLFEFETSGGKRTAFSITGYKLLGDHLRQQQELISRKISPGDLPGLSFR